MAEPPVLELRGIAKSFGGQTVLANVSLNIRAGERRGVIGPNGAGKTTLINIITGAMPPDAGELIFQGRLINSLPPHRRNRLGIGRSFQILSLFGEMTVGEAIRTAILRYRGLHMRWLRRANAMEDIFTEAAHVAALAGLAGALEERTDTLPYGMQRRLDIALVLAQNPALIVLDEPAAGLSATETRALIAMLKTTLGDRTLIIVEHDMDVVYALTDRITVLDYGRVLTEGNAAEINANAEVRRVYLGAPA